MSKKELQITIVQPTIIWEDIEGNRTMLEQMISEIDQTDVILLPEMFTTGFTMNVETFFETMDGTTLSWMKKLSRNKNAAIAGSIIIKEKDSYYNRLLWVNSDGSVFWYDKRHLFTMGGEHIAFSKGDKKLIVECKGWKICPLICYDLRFPVWSRNKEGYDLLIYLANWPSARHQVWKTLLEARAIENQAFVVGVNRTGTDGLGLNYLGGSGCVDAKGKASFLDKEPRLKTLILNYSELSSFREKFPLLPDSDSFVIHDKLES